VNSEFLTNSSVRERFGIAAKNSATASRLIKEAVEAGRIRPHDPDASKKFMKYVPWWANQNPMLSRALFDGSCGLCWLLGRWLQQIPCK